MSTYMTMNEQKIIFQLDGVEFSSDDLSIYEYEFVNLNLNRVNAQKKLNVKSFVAFEQPFFCEALMKATTIAIKLITKDNVADVFSVKSVSCKRTMEDETGRDDGKVTIINRISFSLFQEVDFL